jgi:signal transduction histidine kinase
MVRRPPPHMSSAAPTKTEPSRPSDGSFMAPIIGAIAIVAVGFVAATFYMEARASAIDRDTEQIEDNALPSVEHLAAARAALWRLEMSSREFANEGKGRAQAAADMEAERKRLNHELAAEFASDLYPGEGELQSSAMHLVSEVDLALERLRELDQRSPVDAHAFEEGDLRRAFEQADAAIERIESLNAEEGHAEAHRIAGVRAGSIKLTFALNLACLTLTALATLIAVRAVRRQREVELAHEGVLETRAADLERFASRVAHDLLAPLSALHFTLSTLKRNAEKGLPLDEPIERARACLKRSQNLVDGVMDFARSGAASSGGRANLRATLDGLLDDVRADSSEVEIVVEGVDDDLFVACTSGVLGSILSNLVRNAVKYMEDRPDKRVTIRASTKGGTVRVEVEDTGPGLAPGLAEHVFEPYVRSQDNPKPGVGLGLATVERFVESHRGRVGVESSLGQGSLFWFELPRAESATAR